LKKYNDKYERESWFPLRLPIFSYLIKEITVVEDLFWDKKKKVEMHDNHNDFYLIKTEMIIMNFYF
jgi:hypothetical protein